MQFNVSTNLLNLLTTQGRDLIILRKGSTLPVKITPALAARGWRGGELARWASDNSGDPIVDIANGQWCGFFAFGSNEDSDQFTAMTGQNVRYGYAVLFLTGTFMYTRVFETYGYAARHGGPQTPLVYRAMDSLYASENGKLTNEDESNAAINPGGLYPDGTPIVGSFNSFGHVVAAPSAATAGYLGLQT